MRFFLLITVIFFFNNLPNAFANNVVHIDIDFLLKESIVGKKILDELNAKNEDILEKLKKKENDLNYQKNEIESLSKIISNEEYNKRFSILKKKIELYNEEKKTLLKDFENLKQTELNAFFDALNSIMADYMEKNSINIILDKSNIVMANKNLDISREILKIINQNG